MNTPVTIVIGNSITSKKFTKSQSAAETIQVNPVEVIEALKKNS
jgi:hypothetical protein